MDLKRYLAKFNVQDWVFTLFSILWIGVIILDYLNKQVVYIPSITHFKYFNLFAFLTLLGIVLSSSFTRSGPLKKFRAIPVNGLVVFCLTILVIWAITLSYNRYWNAPLDITNYMLLAGKGIYTIGSAFLLVLACFSSGNLLRTRFVENIRPENTGVLLDICLGFVLYTSLLMLLGSLALFKSVYPDRHIVTTDPFKLSERFFVCKKNTLDSISKTQGPQFLGRITGLFYRRVHHDELPLYSGSLSTRF